jgi:hypothetical protein
MLDFAEFDSKIFFVYCENSDDNRTLVGILLLLFRGIFFVSIKRIGIFCGSMTYSNAGYGISIKESFGVFSVFFYRNKELGLEIRNLVLKVADFSVSGFCDCVKYRSIHFSKIIILCPMLFLGSKLSNTRFPKSRAFVSCVVGIRRPSCSRAKTRIGNRVEGRLLAICLP